MSKAPLARRILKAFAALAILGALGVGTLLASLWLERRIQLTLPTPTGSFAVGRSVQDWIDGALDTLAPFPGTQRELLVWIWYPSTPGQSAAMDEYAPARLRPKDDGTPVSLIGRLFGLLTRDLTRVHGHSIRDSDVSAHQGSYPVVIMRAGASASVLSYSTLAEDLASHGYVVVGFDAPYRTALVVFPDGRVMRRMPENNPELCLGQAELDRCATRLLGAWTADVAFALDRLEQLNTSDSTGKFTGRLDMTRVGVFGHSFGGATAAQFCHDDPRCRAGINVDGAPHGSVIQEGVQRPFMSLLSDHGSASDPVSRQIMADIQSVHDRSLPDGRLRIMIRGANHFLFGDDGGLLKSHIVLRALRMAGIVGIDGRRQLAVAAYCIHSFFDVHLKGASVSPLETANPLYPEIQVLEDGH